MSEMIIGEDLHEKKVRLGLSSQVVLRLRFWSQIGYDVAEAEELSRRIYDYYSAGRMESQSRPDILGIELDILQSFFFDQRTISGNLVSLTHMAVLEGNEPMQANVQNNPPNTRVPDEEKDSEIPNLESVDDE